MASGRYLRVCVCACCDGAGQGGIGCGKAGLAIAPWPVVRLAPWSACCWEVGAEYSRAWAALGSCLDVCPAEGLWGSDWSNVEGTSGYWGQVTSYLHS